MEAALNSSLGRTVLGPGVLRIGRATDNTLVIQDQQASSHHTEITPGFGGASYQIIDLGSTNGTFVNEQRLTPSNPRILNPGDVIRIGSMNLTYEMSGAGAGYDPTVAASGPNYSPTVAASGPNYSPTVAASGPNYSPTVAASGPTYEAPDPSAQTVAQTAPPAFQQPPAYGNYPTPAQPSYTPPPVYPQPQAAYPQEQPMYAAQPAYAQQGYPQPGYPQPGGFGQVGMPPQRKSNKGLFIAIAVILVLIVGGGGAFFYVQSLSSPQKTLQAYCNALKAGDYQTAYNQFSSTVQSRISETQFAGLLRLGIDLEGGMKDCTVTNVTQDSSTTAHGTLTYTFGNGKTNTGNGPLILENGTWKLDESAPGN